MERMMPLYEAKMIHHYDTRWATYQPDGSTRLMTEAEKAQRLTPMPRYWVHESEVSKKVGDKWAKPWFLGWRDITNVTNERTAIATLIPRVAVGNQMPLAMPDQGLERVVALQAAMTSFAFDFVARQKAGGTHLNFFIYSQLPAPKPPVIVEGLTLPKPFASWVATAVDRLNAWTAPVDERAAIRAELDALMFHVYGVTRDDAAYIMDTFPIVRRKDIDRYGEYRTKRLILEAYDAMASAIA
jgi:hypothetical protein